MKNFLSNYYTDNKEWIEFALKWFMLAIVLGGLAFFIKPDLIDQVIGIFQSKFGPDPARDAALAREIFIQNSIACLIALAGGMIFGISSFVIIFFNGFIIGFVVLALLAIPGNPLRNLEYVILGLVPHGIFELPAFLLASALGLRLGIEWIKEESRGRRFQVFRANLFRAFYALPILALLLLIAAFVEVFVSGQFVGN